METWIGDASREGVLKAMLTDDFRTHHQKFKGIDTTENFIKTIISSQSDWFAPIEPGTQCYP